MALRLGTACRNAGVVAVTGVIDAGGSAGTIKVYTGAQPATVAGNPSGTLLATLTFSRPAFGSPSTGVVTAASIASDTNAAASGTAGHAAVYDSAAVPQMDMTCGQGTGDLSFDNSAIVAGGTVAISSMTVNQPIQ